MLNKNLLLLIIILVFSAGCTAQKKDGNTCAIAFYNLENLFHPDNDPKTDDEEFTPQGAFHYTDNIYRQKLHNIATVLQQLGTDADDNGAALIGVAEVENGKVLADLLSQSEIKPRNYKYAWFDSPDPRGIDVALIYNPKKFTLLKAVPIGTDVSEDDTRDILQATGVLMGDTVHVLVNHWPSRREGKNQTAGKRYAAAARNRKLIKQIQALNANAKILLMGDFNDNPTDASIVNELGAFANKAQVNNQGLYNPMADIYTSGSGSILFQHHWDLFDQIILSGTWLNGKKWRFSKAEVFNRDFLVTQRGKFKGYPHRSFAGTHWINGYSDHLPVVVYLSKE